MFRAFFSFVAVAYIEIERLLRCRRGKHGGQANGKTLQAANCVMKVTRVPQNTDGLPTHKHKFGS